MTPDSRLGVSSNPRDSKSRARDHRAPGTCFLGSRTGLPLWRRGQGHPPLRLPQEAREGPVRGACSCPHALPAGAHCRRAPVPFLGSPVQVCWQPRSTQLCLGTAARAHPPRLPRNPPLCRRAVQGRPAALAAPREGGPSLFSFCHLLQNISPEFSHQPCQCGDFPLLHRVHPHGDASISPT